MLFSMLLSPNFEYVTWHLLIDSLTSFTPYNYILQKYVYEIFAPQEIAEGKTKKMIENGVPNLRTYLPYYQEGYRQALNTVDLEEPDDMENELKTSNATGEPLRQGSVFRCGNDCDAKFLNYRNLVAHELAQNCFKRTRESISGHVVREYAAKMGSARFQRPMTTTERRHLPTVLEAGLEDIELTPKLASYLDEEAKTGRYPVGFALRVRSMPTDYNTNQINYIKRIFLEGELPNKKKADPGETSK